MGEKLCVMPTQIGIPGIMLALSIVFGVKPEILLVRRTNVCPDTRSMPVSGRFALFVVASQAFMQVRQNKRNAPSPISGSDTRAREFERFLI